MTVVSVLIGESQTVAVPIRTGNAVWRHSHTRESKSPPPPAPHPSPQENAGGMRMPALHGFPQGTHRQAASSRLVCSFLLPWDVLNGNPHPTGVIALSSPHLPLCLHGHSPHSRLPSLHQASFQMSAISFQSHCPPALALLDSPSCTALLDPSSSTALLDPPLELPS